MNLIWSLLLSCLIAYLFSFFWYMFLFRNPYMLGLGKTAEQMSRGPSLAMASILQCAGYAITFFAIYYLFGLLGISSAKEVLLYSFLFWIGFVIGVIGPMYAFQAYSFNFFLIVSGNILISFVFLSFGAFWGRV